MKTENLIFFIFDIVMILYNISRAKESPLTSTIAEYIKISRRGVERWNKFYVKTKFILSRGGSTRTEYR